MNARIVTHFFWKPAGFFMASLLLFGGAVGANAPVISHGPLLGEVTSTSVRVWARTNEPATIEFRYGKDSASLDGVSEKVQTEAGHDFTGWTTLQNHSSDTGYVVQVFIDGNPIGVPATFRTLPDSKALRDEKHNPRGLFNFSFQQFCL